MTILLLIIALLVPSWVGAVGTLTQAANPPEPIIILSQSAIPFIKSSSGTMGNNGAVSAMTALPRIISGGAYLYLPAGAIAAGVPASADWYWFVASSTTAGTVYNQTYANNKDSVGTPRIPSANTAFATTGPGAYVGATGAVTTVSLTLPANSMGINGHVSIDAALSFNNSAGTKADAVLFGAQSASGLTLTTQLSAFHSAHIVNRGVANIQSMSRLAGHSQSVGTGSARASDTTVNTAAAVTISVTVDCNTATDHHILEMYSVQIMASN